MNKNRTITFLLALFLGAFGAHRFYVAKPGTACTILVMTFSVFLSPISIIWQIVDVIMIATGSFKDGKGGEIKEW